ncbi:MAG: PQQ-dependent sugar dehydrogenase [Bacteroidota bacterium]
MRSVSLFVLLSVLFTCTTSTEKTAAIAPVAPAIYTAGLPLEELRLPEGFHISVYADSLTNARSLAWSPEGTLFVGTRGEGSVYAVRDTDGDYRADERYVLAEDLNMPNGVALRNGDLYVAEVNRILKFPDIENNLADPGEPVVIYDEYPTEKHHGWKYIAFGPDDKLYIPVGAPCNICLSEDEVFASITRMNPDGSEVEVVQHGVRNTVGFTWHPETKELWFTDNGRDLLGDDLPGCELNRATADGQHFGYPFCHQGDLADPELGDQRDCDEFRAPVQVLGAHVAPLGLEFYQGQQFPDRYRNQILIAEHGSWNRSKKSGYRLMQVTLNEQHEAISYTPFVEGWLDVAADEAWGRPVDLEHLPDGSLLVADDFADVVYRISWGATQVSTR